MTTSTATTLYHLVGGIVGTVVALVGMLTFGTGIANGQPDETTVGIAVFAIGLVLMSYGLSQLANTTSEDDPTVSNGGEA